MKIADADLAELKQLYFVRYRITLSNEEVKELAQKLTTLFSVIGKKIPEEKN